MNTVDTIGFGQTFNGNLYVVPDTYNPTDNGMGDAFIQGTVYTDTIKNWSSQGTLNLTLNSGMTTNSLCLVTTTNAVNGSTGSFITPGGIAVKNIFCSGINNNGFLITNVTSPGSNLDVANKWYVDNKTSASALSGSYTAGQLLIAGLSSQINGYTQLTYNTSENILSTVNLNVSSGATIGRLNSESLTTTNYTFSNMFKDTLIGGSFEGRSVLDVAGAINSANQVNTYSYLNGGIFALSSVPNPQIYSVCSSYNGQYTYHAIRGGTVGSITVPTVINDYNQSITVQLIATNSSQPGNISCNFKGDTVLFNTGTFFARCLQYGTNYIATASLSSINNLVLSGQASQTTGYAYACGTDIYKSTNCGSTWVSTGNTGSWNCIDCSEYGQNLLIGGTSALYYSVNYGSTVNLITTAPTGKNWATVVYTKNDRYMYAFETTTMTAWRSSTGVSGNYSQLTGLNAMPVGLLSSNRLISADISGQYVLTSGTVGFQYSSDYGTTWTNSANNPIFYGDNVFQVTPTGTVSWFAKSSGGNVGQYGPWNPTLIAGRLDSYIPVYYVPNIRLYSTSASIYLTDANIYTPNATFGNSLAVINNSTINRASIGSLRSNYFNNLLYTNNTSTITTATLNTFTYANSITTANLATTGSYYIQFGYQLASTVAARLMSVRARIDGTVVALDQRYTGGTGGSATITDFLYTTLSAGTHVFDIFFANSQSTQTISIDSIKILFYQVF